MSSHVIVPQHAGASKSRSKWPAERVNICTGNRRFRKTEGRMFFDSSVRRPGAASAAC